MALKGSITWNTHPGYDISDKHIDAQEFLADILSEFYWRVHIELDAPVPNPARVLWAEEKARSTKPYDLDVFAEDPIWANVESVKYQKIAIEIDCKYGHGNKFQITRDDQRMKAIKDFYNVPIYGYSCHEVVGAGYKDILKKRHPCHQKHEYLRWWGIVPKRI